MEENGFLLIAVVSGLTAVTMAASVIAVAKLRAKWALNTGAVLLGKSFGAGHRCPCTVWGIAGDGVDETIWGIWRGDSKREWCIKADGKTVKWVYLPIASDPVRCHPIGQPSLVDVSFPLTAYNFRARGSGYGQRKGGTE